MYPGWPWSELPHTLDTTLGCHPRSPDLWTTPTFSADFYQRPQTQLYKRCYCFKFKGSRDPQSDKGQLRFNSIYNGGCRYYLPHTTYHIGVNCLSLSTPCGQIWVYVISHDSFKPEKSFWSVCSTPVRDEIFIARSVLCLIDGWTKKTTSYNQLFLDGQHVLHIKFIHNLGLGRISLHLAVYLVPMNGQHGLVRQSSPVKVSSKISCC